MMGPSKAGSSRSTVDPLDPRLHDGLASLCALYFAGEISEEERALLRMHMAYCPSCHESFRQYAQIFCGVVPALAGARASEASDDRAPWASRHEAAERRLMSRLDQVFLPPEPLRGRRSSWRIPVALAAACTVASAILVERARVPSVLPAAVDGPSTAAPAPRRDQGPARSLPATGAGEARALAGGSGERIASLRSRLDADRRLLGRSRLAIEGLARQLEASRSAGEQAISARDSVSAEAAAADREAESLESRLAELRAAGSREQRRMEALQAEIRELNRQVGERDLALSEKDRMLDLDRDFLAHDRDIRDLMGSRSLYILDIFDSSEKDKPARQFGRIFFTRDRSLVFYGFDLDGHAGNRQDVSYQLWGSGGDQGSPVSLGLFYQDDSHKRWMLRCDDRKALARLNMVFVTVEPQGGSSKPTGKPLLRAYLDPGPGHP